MEVFSDYRRTLKLPEAEEVFDLVIYRPLAYIFVRSIARTAITPNQVTFLSMLFGVSAGLIYSQGRTVSFCIAGIVYAAANILDCADGQLARLKNSGTLFGRVVDGAADYISSVAIFIGIGLGVSGSIRFSWILVVAAGVSSAVHAMFFDHYQSEFISAVRSERNFLDREEDQFNSEISRLRQQAGSGIKIFVLRLYLWYLNLQRSSSTKRHQDGIDPQRYRNENLRMIRLWSFLGPTTNRTLLIVCSFFGRIDVYIVCIIIAGNLWLAGCYLLQRIIHKRLIGPTNEQ